MNSRHWLENLNRRALGQITHIFLSECWNCEEIGAFLYVGRSGGLLIEEFDGFAFRIGEQLVAGSYDHFMIELANRFST